MKFTISGKEYRRNRRSRRAAVRDKLGKLERYFTPDTEVDRDDERGEGAPED